MKLTTWCALILGGTCLSTNALAQDDRAQAPQPAAVSGDRLEDIVVTARRRNEAAQKTPLSITAFSSGDLALHSIETLGQIQQQTPGLTFAQSVYDVFGSFVGIRGQRTTDVETSQDPAVAIYVDGVYQGGTVGNQLGELLDVERIEVLKGSQGTLYGRNTTGGAISITSKLPTDRFEGEGEASVGNYGLRQGHLILNLPLADGAALRIAGSAEHHDGYSHDRTYDKDLQDVTQGDLHATLRLDPTERLEVIVRGDFSQGLSNNYTQAPIAMAPFSGAAFEVAAEEIGIANLFDAKGNLTPRGFAAVAAAPSAYLASRPGLRIQDSSSQLVGRGEYSLLRAYGASLTTTYRLNDQLSLKYIGSYRHQYADQAADGDGSPFNIFSFEDQTKIDQDTHELQLNGDILDNRLKFTVGGFYYHMLAPEDNSNASVLPVLVDVFEGLRARTEDTSGSVYGQGTFAITRTLNVTGGLRYTNETRRVTPQSFSVTPAMFCLIPTADQIGGACIAHYKSSYSNVSYTAGLDWTPVTGLMVYGKTSRGFKGGSPNQRGTNDPGTYDPFRPEQVQDYEVGLKSELLDRRLRANIDYYRTDYTDIQRAVSVRVPSGQLVTEVQNAASGRIDGVEFEARAVPVSGLTLGASTAYTDARYLRYIDPAGGDLSFLHFYGQPKWTYSLSGSYSLPTGFGSMQVSLDYYWQGDTDYAVSSTLHNAGMSNAAVQPAYGLLNGRISAHVEPLGVDLAFWMRNIANKNYFGGINDLSSSLGLVLGIPAPPRTFAVEVTKKF